MPRSRSVRKPKPKPKRQLSTDRERGSSSEHPPSAAPKAALIYVSEKHHDVLAKLGFTATASADNLQNCNVAIVVDADERERSEEIARSLDGVAASVRILDLGDVPSR